MRRRARTAILIGSLGLFAACGAEPPAEEPAIRPVRYEAVFSTGGERTRTFSGTAHAGVESRLSFKVSGTIDALPVKVGNVVQRGDLIAELDATDYDLRVQDARAALSRTEAELRQAQSNYGRTQQLYEDRNASKADLDAARAAAEAAEAAVESSRQGIAMAQRSLGYTRLTAPVAGAISSVPVEVNENASIGQVVAVLTSGSQPEVECSVPGRVIGQIREGSAVTVEFDAIPGEVFDATVTEVGVTASGAGTTFPVKARLERETTDVRPGMAAEVSFRFEGTSVRERIYVPASSVLEDRGGRFAFIVEPAEEGFGTVRRRDVTVGELVDHGLEIFEGLTDGDLLVTAGVTKIQDGQTVRLPAAAATSP